MNDSEKIMEESIKEGYDNCSFGYSSLPNISEGYSNSFFGDFNKIFSVKIYDFLNEFDYIMLHKQDGNFDEYRMNRLKEDIDRYISVFKNLRKIITGEEKWNE